MNACVVLTVLAPDRPGIVKSLSETVAAHEGNWLESRMARLAGHFAGILRVECPQAAADSLIAALEAIEGLSIQAKREDPQPARDFEQLKLEVVGNDRPGIVRGLSAAIAGTGANVEELQTSLESAPMAGHPLFVARGTVALPEGLTAASLIEAIEGLGEDLSVTVE
jgi:glycine cleavage system regulatory protein